MQPFVFLNATSYQILCSGPAGTRLYVILELFRFFRDQLSESNGFACFGLAHTALFLFFAVYNFKLIAFEISYSKVVLATFC